MYFFILIPEWLPHVFLSSFSPINDIFWEINNGISLEFSCINLFSSVFPFLFKLALFSIYFFSQTAEYLLSVKYSFRSSQNFSHNRFLLDVYSSRCNEILQRIVEEYQTLHVNLAHILNVILILSLSLSPHFATWFHLHHWSNHIHSLTISFHRIWTQLGRQILALQRGQHQA